MFLALNSKGLYQSLGKEKQVVVLRSRPRQNVNLGTFTLYRATMAKIMYKKRVMHVQNCCFADLNVLLFCRPRRRHLIAA